MMEESPIAGTSTGTSTRNAATTAPTKSSDEPAGEYPTIDATLARAAIMSETLVFCTLALLGGGLFALIAVTNVNWFYPTTFYGAVVYVARQRYFGVSFRAARTPQDTGKSDASPRAAQRPSSGRSTAG